MGGGSWKVAYADFVTAMMAFFLLMWILNMAPKETKAGLAGMFQADAKYDSNSVSPITNNPIINQVDSLVMPPEKLNEVEQSNLAIAKAIKQFLLADAVPSPSSGLTSDNVGVLLHITADLMFKPGTVEFTPEGTRVLDQVVAMMNKYKVYLVVRGHVDSTEANGPGLSKWDLSAGRANAAVQYFISKGIDPRFLRSVAYADTRPLQPAGMPGGATKNSRVEFNFHRPEVMSTIVGY